MNRNRLALLFTLLVSSGFAQTPLELEDLMALSLKNNKGILAASLEVDQAEALMGTAFDFDKTDVYFHYDENNLALNGEPLKVFGLQQQFEFPTVYQARRRLQNMNYEVQESALQINQKQLSRALTLAYQHYQILARKAQLYHALDSVYSDFSRAANRRFELGETNYLERTTALAKQKQIANSYARVTKEILIARSEILRLVQGGDSLEIALESPERLEVVNTNGLMRMETSYLENRQGLSEARMKLERNSLFPEINLEYFQGTNQDLGYSLYGVQLGLRIPVLFFGKSSRIQSAKIQANITALQNQELTLEAEKEYQALTIKLDQLSSELAYYENEGRALSDTILKAAQGNFSNGEIDFFQYIQSLENAYEIRINYLDVLSQYNQTVIAINYLTIPLRP